MLATCCLCASARADDSAYQNALRLLSEGRIEEAEASLRTVIGQQPEHAGAWLDLAILQCGMGLTDEAEALFGKIQERFDPPPAIQELIRQIRAKGCPRQDAGQSVARSSFRLGRGHDNNVNQGASNPFSLGGLPLAPEFRPRGDDFTQVSLETTRLFPRYGTTFYGQLQSRQHDHLSRYDLSTALVAAEQPLKLGEWHNRLGISLSAAWLGGHLYQQQAGVHAQILPPWPVLPEGWHYSFLSDVSRVWYPTLKNFDADILRHQLIVNFQDDETQWMGSAGVTRDFGGKNRPGGDKRGWIANVTLRRRLTARLHGELSGARQDWQGDQVYFSGLVDTNTQRKQSTRLWRAAAVYALTPRQSVTLEFKDLKNQENISLFSYRNRQVMLNWQYEFR
ncbi:MAG: tetratricopeptide repeat protein [Zoogloeaceae bacterium]|nr:tetratricopeptide repeat protein [Zoogloeaceae bacterium]